MTKPTSRQSMIVLALSLIAAIGLVAAIAFKPVPRLIWNASKSVPLGPYFVHMRQPEMGQIAVIRPADWVRHFAASRGYLPENIWLLKPVFAAPGSIVCRFGKHIFVDGKLVAKVRIWDRKHRPLPVWKGCHALKSDEVFVLAKPRDSFDSRYFGPVNREQIVGTVTTLTDIAK